MNSATEMLESIRGTLKARAEGFNEGGDIEVMVAVDAIVRMELRDVLGWLKRHAETHVGHRQIGKGGHDGNGNSWAVVEIPVWDALQMIDRLEGLRLEKMTLEELDAELRREGIDPVELDKRMLKRLLEERARGVDTPMLHEAISQFEEAVGE